VFTCLHTAQVAEQQTAQVAEQQVVRPVPDLAPELAFAHCRADAGTGRYR
jgi:hypothetical protein